MGSRTTRGGNDQDNPLPGFHGLRELGRYGHPQKQNFDAERDGQHQTGLGPSSECDPEHEAVDQNVDTDQRQQPSRPLDDTFKLTDRQHHGDPRETADDGGNWRSAMRNVGHDLIRRCCKHDTG